MTRGKLLPLPLPETRRRELSDEALVAASALDPNALGALYDRFHERVHRFLYRFLGGDRGDLDDLVQVTFLEVRRAAAQFRGRSTAATWIFGVAANVARHEARGAARRRAALDRFPDGVARSPETLPDATAERRQLLAILSVAVAELSPDHRVAFLLCDVEGMAGVDVARALGLREGTLWRRLHEARRRLRAAFDGGRR